MENTDHIETAFLDRTVYTGRPKDETGLLPKEIRSYDLLDSLGITYSRLHHSAHATIEACAEVDQLLGTNICKNLFLCNRQKTDFYLVMMPGEKKFKTKELSKQLGVARLSFAEECFMEQFLDITPGSVSVLGLMNDTANRVQLIIDRDVIEQEYIACHPCINTASLRFPTSDLLEKILPAIHHEPILVTLTGEDA
ncbi:MAG: prolyl-tRNA synthetase associated domain-containing protein [Lachnospiraceae bacterium]|nr:prolyl-tRNA synthetase associated domain-containing protein [Lachnospiraceae bacterium]